MAVAAPPAPQTDACAICLEQCTRRTSLDGCTHAFCYDCIKTWTNTTNTCPQCRTRIHKLTEQTRGTRKRGKSEIIADKDVTEANWVHTLYDTDEEEYAFLAEAYGLALNPRLGGYVDDGGFVVEDDVVSYEASQESTHSSSEEEEEDEFLSLSPTTLRELGCSDLIMENIRQAQRNRREARQYCRAMRRESERHLPAPPPPMRTRKRASQEPPDEDEEEEESYPSDSNDSDNSSSSAPSAPPPARKRRRRAR
jgi:hypothetical protein